MTFEFGGRLGFKKFSRPSYIIVTVTETHMGFFQLTCSEIYGSPHNDLVQMKQSKVSNPVKKLIVCNLEAAMQLVVLIMDSPFKVHCAFICRIINITVFIHIILCANICNISISIPNKVAIEKMRTSFGHIAIGDCSSMIWHGLLRGPTTPSAHYYHKIYHQI